MKSLSFVAMCFALFSNVSFGKNGESEQSTKRLAVAPSASSSQFYIEKGLVDKVYKQATSDEAERVGSSGKMLPNIGILSAQEFKLQNDYFAIDYADQVGTLPFISFAITSEVARLRRVSFGLKGEVGYSYKQGTFDASSSSGPDIEDTVTLQWAPVIVGFSGEYFPPWADWIIPSLDIVSGAHWLHHTGTLDGLDQSTWVPIYGGGLNFALFSNRSSEDAFGGVTVGATYQQSVESEQAIRGWMYRIGSAITL